MATVAPRPRLSPFADAQVARAGVVEVVGSLAVKSAMVVQTAVVARLFGIEAVGAWATAMLLVAAATSLSALRLDQMLLVSSEEESELDSAFTLTLVAGCAGAGVLWLSSDVWARLMGSAELGRHVRWLSPLVLLAALSLPAVLWERTLRYGVAKLPALVGIGTFVLSAVWTGRNSSGPDALVVAQLLSTGASVSVIWLLAPRRPRLRLHSSARSRHLAFGGAMWIAGVASFISMQGDDALVRYFHGDAALGIYLVAFYVPGYLIAIVEVMSRVGLPVLSRVKTAGGDVRGAFSTLSKCIAMISVPLGTVVVVFANEIVAIVYGPQWADAAPYLRVFGVAFVLRSATGSHWQLLAVLYQRTSYVMWTAIASAAFMVVVGPPLIWRYGIMGGAMYSFLQLAVMGPLVRFPLIRSTLGDLSYLRGAVGPLAAGALAAASSLGLRALTEGAPVATVVLVFGVVYMICLYVLERAFFRYLTSLVPSVVRLSPNVGEDI